MAKRDSATKILPSLTPRRSARLLKNHDILVTSLQLSDTISNKLSKPSNGFKNCGSEPPSNLRRSPRISTKDSVGKEEYSSCEDLGSGLIKSSKNNDMGRFQNRRSQRLSNCSEKTSGDKGVGKEAVLHTGKGNLRVKSGENLLDKGKRSTKRQVKESDGECRVVKDHQTEKSKGNNDRISSNLNTGKGKSSTAGRVKEPDGDGECRGLNAGRKRKREEQGKENVNGWNEDQELALQRAYLAAKPTPHFWKKVSKMVPGKSAQECFDKVNADHLTPPQRQRGAKKRRSVSPIHSLELSASKVLKPVDLNLKNRSCNNQKTRITQKNARKLLKEHYNQNQDHDADLFSVLEPNLDLSIEALQPNHIFSTPKNCKQGLLQKYSERSTSGKKIPLLSRFSGSKVTTLASPPVLKQVKNKFLHERYIDQLHTRDAKRKAAAAKKATLKIGDGKENNVMKMDVVRSAKNALVSDAREAITMLQNIKTNTMSNSSDLDDDIVRSDDDDGES